jgi:hypothetical protein
MSNTTENTDAAPAVTEADINKPRSDAPAPAASATKAKAKAKAKAKTAPALTEAELAAAIEAEIAAEEEKEATPTPPAPLDVIGLANVILAKTGEGPTVAKAAARVAARQLHHPADILALSRQVESSKRGDAAARKAAVEQLNQAARRMLELSDRPPADFTVGDHGLYAGFTPSGTYGVEAGVVSKRGDRKVYSGFGLYFRCEHLEPNDGRQYDVTGI